MTYDPSIRGNSAASVAGRAGRAVRQANAWKVRAGRLTAKQLRRWVREIEREARRNPEDFAHWSGVVRRATA